MDWNDLFPDQKPEQVQAKLAADAQKLSDAEKKAEEWKGHARTWEDRAKENKTRVSALEAELEQARETVAGAGDAVDAATAAQLEQRAKDAESELTLTKKLVGLGADAASLLDSLSFRDEIAKLDPEAEDFDETFTALVKEREPQNGGPFVPNYPGVRRQVSGGDAPKPSLWEEVHGDKKQNNLNTL